MTQQYAAHTSNMVQHTETKRVKKDHVNVTQKKVGVVTLISDKLTSEERKLKGRNVT